MNNTTPDPNRLHYIAEPDTSKGIIVDHSDGNQRVVLDASTGAIVLKPKHLPTLNLLDFTPFLSLMFRAMDMARSLNTPAADAACNAVQLLVIDLTRQYEACRNAKATSPP